MARGLEILSFLFVLFLVLVGSTTEARPLNILEPHHRPRMMDKGFFDGLSIGAIKQSGPSPGAGNKYTDSRGFGGIKDGPSPGQGH
ncbi:conserved hypothetical protein [Ricinus communis]|uniref:Uncharacterized protein n=2 Tax=Ricinus communis TaxID=3988 RepID=B9SG11_RICCO|nr:conserved hypothetical protein [Ricinus communis]